MISVETPSLKLPEPVGLQYHWLDSAASRKVLRIGRRGTKTRFALLAGVHGHGPGWEDGTPKFPGILQGGDVVWIAQTYTNLTTVLWREEIEPRFGDLPWARLDKTRHDLHLDGLGSLLLRSGEADAIRSVRGVGARLVGVIVDEAAWLALSTALKDVILPALLDNGGWLIIMSTTNAGPDGDYDDVGRQMAPSFFNRLCGEIERGDRGPEWQLFVGTAYDNPTLDTAAIDELVSEYTPGSTALRQEVYAEILEPGLGLAMPHLCEQHFVPPFRPEVTEWKAFAAFDWGYHHPWVMGLYLIDGDGQVVKKDTLTGRQDLPADIDAKVRAAGVDPDSMLIFAGGDCWRARRNDRSRAGGNGPTVAEALMGSKWRLTPANDARVAGLNNFRRYTNIPEGAPDDYRPRFVWMDTPGNRACHAQCKAMTLDPKNPEDAEKVDADSSGRGGDDFYDENRYALMSRPLPLKQPRPMPQKIAHRAAPIIVKDGRLVPAKRPATTVEQLVEQAERRVGRTEHRERLPRRKYS